jgi:hypothetical protein
MTRPITKRFLVRTLNRVARIAYNVPCNDSFAQALVKAGLKSRRFRYLGAYLSNVAHLMAKFEPATSELRACAECRKPFTAHLDHPGAVNRRYCSDKCRLRAHKKRHATDPSDKPHAETRASVS